MKINRVELDRFICFLTFITLQLLITQDVTAQDPNLPPSGNFDLTRWKITLPDQTEIKELELSDGFESPDEFYTDPTTGAMVFKCPNDGETGGSTYPRSELREMLRAGNTSISTTGVGLNNWVFSSSSQSVQDASGAVDGKMTATVAVDYVSISGESSKVGRVIIGQIHASDNEPCRIYYRKLPGNALGSIYFAHEPNTGSEVWYEMIGSRSSSASNPSDGIALGEKFNYEIEVEGDILTVTISRDGKADVQEIVDMSDSGFEDDWMYFKAGNYNQNNSGDDYAQVSFFALDVSHDEEVVVGIEDQLLPEDFSSLIYPNPSASRFTIEYELNQTTHVELIVYNESGQTVTELINETKRAGKQVSEWFPGSDLSNGLYLAVLKIGKETKTFKMVLDKK